MNKIDSSYINRILILYPDLKINDLKIIGWGAGKEFSEHYEKLGINIDYTICIYEENQGKIINGVKVLGPQVLNKENAENTLIIVFSMWWFDVYRQIKEFGNFRAIRAFNGWTKQHELSSMDLNKGLNQKPLKIDNHRCAILMQGPLEYYTPMALKLTKQSSPDTPLILSTWNGYSPKIIDECMKYADFVLMNSMPTKSGPNGLNLIRQQFGVLSGLNRLKEAKISYALKIRTDTSIYGDLDFNKLVHLTHTEYASKLNLKGKIIFSGLNSWKYIPYHLTDQYQFGLVSDLINYWSFEKSIEISSVARDEEFYYFSLATPESAICRSFIARNSVANQSIKYSELSIEKYWNLLKSEFGLFPEPELTFCKWKSISLSSINTNPVNQYTKRLMDPIDVTWHESLINHDLLAEEVILYSRGYTISDFARNAIIKE
jgi:hypothetical protein